MGGILGLPVLKGLAVLRVPSPTLHHYRILYAFDPRRIAILLIGGNKKGQDDWYKTFIPLADKLYDDHLKSLTLKSRGCPNG